jgi:hypothetical protein
VDKARAVRACFGIMLAGMGLFALMIGKRSTAFGIVGGVLLAIALLLILLPSRKA